MLKTSNDWNFQVPSQKIIHYPFLGNPTKGKQQLIFHSQGFIKNYTKPTQWGTNWTEK